MSTAPSSISDLIAELVVEADRIDRLTDAPAPRIGIGADTLWDWERLLRSAAVALTEALHLANTLRDGERLLRSAAERRTLARALTPIAVRDYALARGWHDNRVKGRVWLLSHGDHPLRQLLVPQDVQDPAFEAAMLDVATRLAEIEHRTIGAVLADLAK